MLRRWGLPSLTTAALFSLASLSRAAVPPRAPASAPAPPAPAAAPSITPHRYSLPECLALADRNFPNLWAARARLASAHAQLEEARWTPWFQWNAQGSLGVAPPLLGSVVFPLATLASRNINSVTGLQPFAGFGLSGVVPLYTFGKIDTALDAAEAGVRVSEWDMEKWRQQTRMDVRRAYFGLQLARDTKDLLSDGLDRVSKAIQGMRDRLARGDANVSDADRLRLEVFRQDIALQLLLAGKNEAYALATLRFLTGVQTSFDVVDVALKRPDRPVGPIVQYLEAARVLRPDVNMARAGVVARRALAAYNRAKLLPDFGLGLGADFLSTPSAAPQQSVWSNDPYNHFGYFFGFGVRWGLDIVPQAARLQQAEEQLVETRSLEDLALGNAMHEVEKAYADVTEAKSREEAWDKAEHIAKHWLAIAQDHVNLGTWDERALMEPLRSYGWARVQHYVALMDYNVAMCSLSLASGWDSAAPTGN